MKELNVSLSFLEDTQALGDAETGRLVRAMLLYAFDGTEPDLKGNERMLWSVMKREIDRQRKCYDNKVAGAEKARQIRSDIRVNQNDIRVNQNDIKANQNYKEKESSKEKETVCVKDPNTNNSIDINNKYINKQELNHMFDIFWEAYPRKVGKKKAKTKWDIIQPSRELLETMLSAIEAWRKTDQWGRGYVPNPETWLNQERWNDRVPDKVTEIPRRERERMNGLADMERRMREREAREAMEEALARGGNA